jgi:hypothetical protein
VDDFSSCLPSPNEHYDLMVITPVLLAVVWGLNLKPVFFMAFTYSL